MDKFEYKIKADEIKELIAQREYEQAAEIADSIDWRRVKSVMMLCTVSDLYKMCRRYEDSRDMLLLAYDRHPGGRTIVYSLCELSIKMEEFVQAVEYYKEYVQIAPKDSGRYILQYKLYEAQDVSLEERIAVLDELKNKDYREKWAYELAYLYHRVGLATKCVEECDELVLWFGEGKYVLKALELKRLHAPLTPEQQYKYDNRFGGVQINEGQNAEVSSDTIVLPQTQKESRASIDNRQQAAILNAETTRIPVEEIEIQVKTLDVGKYDTINLQEELAAGIQEYFGTANEDAITRSIMAPMLSSDTTDIPRNVVKETDAAVNEDSVQTEADAQEESHSEVFFGETGEIADGGQLSIELEEEPKVQDIAEVVMSQMRSPLESSIQQVQPPKEMANVLSMEGDGQISFVLPERESVEKQITGQISINDIILEWERLKKENEEKRKENVRQHVLQQTGQMFTEFEASVRDGLLEQLEKGEVQEGNLEETLAELFEDKKSRDVVEEITEEANRKEEPLAEDEELVEENVVKAEAVAEEEPADEETGVIAEEELADEETGVIAEEEFADEEAAKIVEDDVVVDDIGEVEELTEIEDAFKAENEEEEAPETDGPAVEEVLTEIEYALEEENEEEEAPETDGPTVVEELTEIEYALEEENEEEEAPETDGPAVVEGLTEIEDAFKAETEVEEAPETEDQTVEDEQTEEEISEESIEEPGENSAEKAGPVEVVREKHKIRNLTREEKELYGKFIQGRSSKEQLIRAIDGISMAAYTGNVIVTGDEGMDSLGLAKNIIREVQMTDSNFSGKIAKISGGSLNTRDVKQIIDGLNNGALIIQKASLMNEETTKRLYKVLQQEHLGIVVVMEDNKKVMDRFLNKNAKLLECFTSRVDIEALSNKVLVAFAKKYAREMEYSIDEMGLLALHTRIADMQTSDHAVTVMDVKEIMDEAIENVNRKSIGHFFDIIFGKRYDDEDMIILKEKDFM